MLGGSSGSNFLLHVRGNVQDYENWVKLGNKGWDWQNVSYYFKKSEALKSEPIMKSKSSSLHNTKGYLGITRPFWKTRTQKYLDAFEEDGHDILLDINGYHQLGYSESQFTISDGVRQSTAYAFLRPIKDRPNLYLLKKTFARKIIFKDKIAVGVEVELDNKRIITLNAKKEIIVSAGSINSPKLLMLSGIGPKKHLEELNIPVLLDAPTVGENLQDHLAVPLILKGKDNLLSILQNFEILFNLNTFPTPAIMGFVAMNKTDAQPDYQTILLPTPAGSLIPTLLVSYVFGINDEISTALTESIQTRETLSGIIVLLHPDSRGKVKLKSNDPHEHPLIYTGFFSNTTDLERFAYMIENYLSVLKTSFFKNLNSDVVDLNVKECKHYQFKSHEYWKCFSLNMAASLFHPVGTCAMGPKGYGVVDERLKVYGIRRLRVIDASVMPLITSGNTNAPTIMIAERASDIIKEDYNLFYHYLPL